MPRQPRIDLPGIAQHVIQRGNDRQPCFFTDADYQRYRTELRELALRADVAIHAYVLMTNHVHLLMTPTHSGRIGRLMQALGRRYVRYVNDRYHRTGTLWEGRYKSCPVGDHEHLLQRAPYIELNPVRAAMVPNPGHYPWSSHRPTALGWDDPLIRPHTAYRRLGATPGERQAAWRALVIEAVPPAEIEAIRRHLQQQHAFGPERFRHAIEAQLGRPCGPRSIGRPPKPPAPPHPTPTPKLHSDPGFGHVRTMRLGHEDGVHQRVRQDFGVGLGAHAGQQLLAVGGGCPRPEYEGPHPLFQLVPGGSLAAHYLWV